ncbi:tRNA (guanosine(46)-N7)-methyltransferase TrmB [Thiothrix fructosivorans]|uniref:tRNA (guanine-N(7)-)-methyltransferase n=1 Tax=Thiothrix fructosivorans TaxID=111770 RepID=A0A8B0SL00_9GAMM|nr:tRNA (guanosine(46)-N7)-methyltransferase TrmB [Thiothrix fructosivorans]MBO0612806.1 tRNA (guanosine(46)-N7)-methyltransferase TrmB [Thiothrix fructosivorans]QTX11735.1 tRNA (guanosine(46)-N7)-methyltransferase TrmB [Thiothrix fructosivorans]
METTAPHRAIKSFVLRQGRVTKAQEEALENLWPVFGIESADTPLDLPSLFGRTAPVTLEIGFGNGDSLAQMAAAAPERDFIGIEVHTPGVGHLLKLVGEQGLKNVRLMNSDAVEILQKRIPAGSLDRVQLFFPDPWHKKKHNKRRIVQAPFAALIASRLQTGGVFHMATDWENYADNMADVMETSPDFANLAPEPPYSPRPETRPLTKFENRGLKLGHGVWDLLYRKIT